MAITIQRVNRTVRSTCAPMLAIVGFSCLLTILFVLYQPTLGPGALQRIDWQSWEVIDLPLDNAAAGSSHEQSADPQVGLGHGAGDTKPGGVDWWNVTDSIDTGVDFASLPLDVWNPLLPHNTGISEITISRCMVSPSMAGDICTPYTTSADDSHKGKWVRIDRNLDRESGAWYLHIYYRRTRRQDIPLIDDVLLLGDAEEPPARPDGSWQRVSRSTRDGVVHVPKLFLWYHLGKTLQEMTNEERQKDLITELDILYGENPPWFGFSKVDPPITAEQEGRIQSVWLTYRRGVKIPAKAPPLHFSHDGKFKIMQVADLHFSVAPGDCRDTILSPCTHSDNLTNTLLSRVLDDEKPDLVVFTGDQLNGQGTSWDAGSVLSKVTRLVIEKKIPWAAVFGNHDSEDELRNGRNGREEQIKMMQALPYSLVQRGPKDVHGAGNYLLKVKSADPSKTHLLTLYFLDSGSYSKGILDWFGFFTPTEYDYIRESQTNWFLQESASIRAIERPFHPDTGKDFGDIWKRQGVDQLTPATRKLAKPNAFMFFHIPLQEAYAKADIDPVTNKALDVGRHGMEPAGSAKKNEGFFEKGLLRATESDHATSSGIPEVKVVGNGHCHITENCRRVKGIWNCFGGGGSYSGYGKVGFDRRFRVYEVSDFGETIKTYKHTEKDEIVDEMALAGKDAPRLSS
ncbi:hypothetical protein PC9H_006359 [Pleurotus ostreatus]|uniref:Calcineurin-like phosphoesterase domain-containing protein n=1 Tax=Pleurotus ostreatus TaxID=5322 RepID=A0A8H7DRF5_PLEOS|nr:uncharacterized protein PC9H_006359 [Pleurotus ostreatus]KAF7430650.1 hypothetical protein PC9H_006359 [Pleurotus ostreatus]KAJ8694970.1 Phosphatase dcr2 [Pleurotus ostreatus]